MENSGRKSKVNQWKTSKSLWEFVEKNPKVDYRNKLEKKLSGGNSKKENQKLEESKW